MTARGSNSNESSPLAFTPSSSPGAVSAGGSGSTLLGAARQGSEDLDSGVQTLIQLHAAAAAEGRATTGATVGTPIVSPGGGGGGSQRGLLPPSHLSTSSTVGNRWSPVVPPPPSSAANAGAAWAHPTSGTSTAAAPSSTYPTSTTSTHAGSSHGGEVHTLGSSANASGTTASTFHSASTAMAHAAFSTATAAGAAASATGASPLVVGSATLTPTVVMCARRSSEILSPVSSSGACVVHPALKAARAGARSHLPPAANTWSNTASGPGASPRGGAPVPPPLDLVPPYRFAIVEDGVYRGAYPVLRNLPFLQTLKLKTIVQLTPEEPTFDLASFAAASRIEVIHIQAERFKGEAQLLPEDLGTALKTLLNVEKHPVYLHCLDGRQVCGLVVMALRKLMQWDIAANHLEYRRFAKSTDDEVAFITDYSGPLEVPARVPPWLWGGQWADAYGNPKPRLHPQIKLKFPAIAPSSLKGVATGGSPASSSTATAATTTTMASASASGTGGGVSAAAAAGNRSAAAPQQLPPSPVAVATGAGSGGGAQANPFPQGDASTGGGGGGSSSGGAGSRLGTPSSSPALSTSPPQGVSITGLSLGAMSAAAGRGASGGAQHQPPIAKPVYIDVKSVAPLRLWGSDSNGSAGGGSATSSHHHHHHRNASSGGGSGDAKRRGSARLGSGNVDSAGSARGSAGNSQVNSTNASMVAGMVPMPGDRTSSGGAYASDAPLWLRDSIDSLSGLPYDSGSGGGPSTPRATATVHTGLLSLTDGSGSYANSSAAAAIGGYTSILSVPALVAAVAAPLRVNSPPPLPSPHGPPQQPQPQQPPSQPAESGGSSRKPKRRSSL